MEIFRNFREFNIYLVEEEKNQDYYIAVKKNIFGKEIAQKINFDIDSRGGLKIVFSNMFLSLDIKLKSTMHILFESVEGNFIPVPAYPDGVYTTDGKTLMVSKEFYEIFENRYLRHKNKFVLYDGVIQEVKFSQVYEHPKLNYTYYYYTIA